MSYGLLFAILVVGAQIAGAILKRRAEREEELKRQQRRGGPAAPQPEMQFDDGTGTALGGGSPQSVGGTGAGAGVGGGSTDPRLAHGMSVLPSAKRLDRHVLDAASSRSDVVTGAPGSIQPRAATHDPFLDPSFGRDAARMAGSPGAPQSGPQQVRTMQPMRGQATQQGARVGDRSAQQPASVQPRPSLRTPPPRPPARPLSVPPAPPQAKPKSPKVQGLSGSPPSSRGGGSAAPRPTDAMTATRAPRPDRAPSAEHAFLSSVAPISAGAITSASSAARQPFRGAASSSAELHTLLHDRAGLRRAMILREVLGPALATRDPLLLPIDR